MKGQKEGVMRNLGIEPRAPRSCVAMATENFTTKPITRLVIVEDKVGKVILSSLGVDSLCFC